MFQPSRGHPQGVLTFFMFQVNKYVLYVTWQFELPRNTQHAAP